LPNFLFLGVLCTEICHKIFSIGKKGEYYVMGTTTIQLNHDTASNWSTNNPTLANGEMGLESDTNKFKIR